MSWLWPFGNSGPKTKKVLSEEKTKCMNKCEAKYNEEVAKLATEPEPAKQEEAKSVENPEVVKSDLENELRPPEKLGGGKRKKSKKNKKSRRKRRTRKSKKCKK
jgi:hypothetical protein